MSVDLDGDLQCWPSRILVSNFWLCPSLMISRLLRSVTSNRKTKRRHKLLHPENELEHHVGFPVGDPADSNSDHFPHTTFNWIGLDGSQLLAHMSPSESYTADCKMIEIRMNITNNANSAVAPDSLFLFGHGDGGGGPTAAMLERLERVQKLVDRDGTGLLPAIKMDGNFEGFYEHVRKRTDNGRNLPTWRGEMYLERHVGRRVLSTSLMPYREPARHLKRR